MIRLFSSIFLQKGFGAVQQEAERQQHKTVAMSTMDNEYH